MTREYVEQFGLLVQHRFWATYWGDVPAVTVAV
jgi:hypothetical protein